jgi:outer membrane protein OmpA-like peptidoglycan-associated protein
MSATVAIRGFFPTVLALWLAMAPACQAASFDALQANWPDLKLRAKLDTSASPEVEQGSNFQVRIAVEDEARIAIVLVNAEGKAQVKIPQRAVDGDRLSRGTEMLFPDLLSGETLYADMPVGKGYVYVIGSQSPIFAAATENDAAPWVAADRVLEKIAAARQADPTLRLAMQRLPLHVVAPAIKDFVSTEDFVQFYGVGTRSVTNADRGFRIEFATASAQLTDWSRRQLDAVSKGMTDQRLARYPFVIEGHTDDVGTDEYNLDLSARRARSVFQYLASRGVTEKRLTTQAVGESKPQVEGTTEAARAANRRVVIRRVDEPR